MKTLGYVRVSTDKQAERGISLEVQAEKIRAMAVVHESKLAEIIVDGGESAKSLNRPGMARLLAMVDAGEVQTVIIAKLDRLTRSVKDLCTLLERFERRGVALVSVAESLDTSSAAGRLVLNIMTAVSQWEREAIGERTRDAMRHKRSNGERVGNISYGYPPTMSTWSSRCRTSWHRWRCKTNGRSTDSYSAAAPRRCSRLPAIPDTWARRSASLACCTPGINNCCIIRMSTASSRPAA